MVQTGEVGGQGKLVSQFRKGLGLKGVPHYLEFFKLVVLRNENAFKDVFFNFENDGNDYIWSEQSLSFLPI